MLDDNYIQSIQSIYNYNYNSIHSSCTNAIGDGNTGDGDDKTTDNKVLTDIIFVVCLCFVLFGILVMFWMLLGVLF